LLGSADYANNWANIWTVLLITRTGAPKVYQDQMRDWLVDKLSDRHKSNDSKKKKAPDAASKPAERPEGSMPEEYTPDWSNIAALLLSAQGDTNTNGAVNFVLAHLGEEIKGNAAMSGKYDMVPLTSRTTG